MQVWKGDDPARTHTKPPEGLAGPPSLDGALAGSSLQHLKIGFHAHLITRAQTLSVGAADETGSMISSGGRCQSNPASPASGFYQKPRRTSRRSAKNRASLQLMAPYLYRWKTRPDAAALERNVDELRTVIIQLRRDLTNKAGYAAKLEYLLCSRLRTIDELRGKLEQSRQQVQRLGLENEVLTAMIAAPPIDAAMLVLRSRVSNQPAAL